MPASNPARTAETDWVDDLRSAAPSDAAVAELRDFLRRALARALSSRGDVDHADLDDFAQDAALRVLDRIASFRGESRFTTWATAVAVRVAFTRLRRRRWGERSLEDLGLDAGGAAPRGASASDPAGEHGRRDVLTALRHAIDRALTPRQRAAILAELAGMPVPVLAEQLGSNPNALYKLLHDARRRLRAALEEAGFSESDVRNAVDGASP